MGKDPKSKLDRRDWIGWLKHPQSTILDGSGPESHGQEWKTCITDAREMGVGVTHAYLRCLQRCLLVCRASTRDIFLSNKQFQDQAGNPRFGWSCGWRSAIEHATLEWVWQQVKAEKCEYKPEKGKRSILSKVIAASFHLPRCQIQVCSC